MERKKKLTYVLHNIAIGGVEVALISALPSLAKKYDLQVIVLGYVDQNMIRHLSEEQKAVFQVFNYPFYVYPLVLGKIVRSISRHDPEIMICSLWRASLVGVCAKWMNSKIRFFSFNHSTRFPHIFSALFTKIAAKNADVILTDGIATSDFVAKTLKPAVPIRVVSFLTQPAPAFIPQKESDNNEIRFMFLGRINKVKNLPLIIKVIEHLRSLSIPCTLDIFGRDDDGSADELNLQIRQARLENYVRLKGEIPSEQRGALFQNYHFYIQLSTFEGMAMSVVEAMQNGLVCVVSPVGEIVHYAKDMESAIFINIQNQAEHWNTDMNKVIEVINNKDLYNKMSVKCRSYFLNKSLFMDSLIEQLEASN